MSRRSVAFVTRMTSLGWCFLGGPAFLEVAQRDPLPAEERFPGVYSAGDSIMGDPPTGPAHIRHLDLVMEALNSELEVDGTIPERFRVRERP